MARFAQMLYGLYDHICTNALQTRPTATRTVHFDQTLISHFSMENAKYKMQNAITSFGESIITNLANFKFRVEYLVYSTYYARNFR